MSPSGADKGGCEEARPCKTLEYALKQGSSVHLLAGEFLLREGVKIGAGANVSFVGTLNSRGARLSTISCLSFCFVLTKADASFRWLSFDKFRYAIATDSDSHIHVADSVFHDTAGGAICFQPNSAVVENSVLYNRVGLFPVDQQTAVVRNCSFHGSYLQLSSHGGVVEVQDSVFENYGVYCDGDNDSGPPAPRRFSNFKSANAGIAVEARYGCHVEFFKSEISQALEALSIFKSKATFTSSTIRNSKQLLWCSGLSSVILRDCTIVDNKGELLTHCPNGVCDIHLHACAVRNNTGKLSTNCTIQNQQ